MCWYSENIKIISSGLKYFLLLNCSFEDDQVIFHGIMFWIWLIHISCVCPVSQLCPTFCDPIDCSSLGSSVHGTLQERILEWVAISFSMGTSQPRYWARVSGVSWTGRIILSHFTPATPESLHKSHKKAHIILIKYLQGWLHGLLTSAVILCLTWKDHLAGI